ncbi:MAG: anion transporter [bacterium]|nr:anion transporter [bacterium]
MFLGGIPGLALDRTGVALLGGIAAVAFGALSPDEAWRAVDVSTMGLLFGLMIVSAQFRLGGFYGWVTRGVASAPGSPPRLLFVLCMVAGGLSALLANDVVCLAMAPLLVEGCARRKMNPAPFLLALACAANAGSAATLIGNPQNMLIGQRLHLSFHRYLIEAGIPSLLSLAAVWFIIARQYRSRWSWEKAPVQENMIPFDVWQTAKGAAVLIMLIAVFLFSAIPREIAALAAAGWLLLSRRMASRRMLEYVDWHLLVLFMGLFIVNHALEASGRLDSAMNALALAGVDARRPADLFIITAVLSNLVSNVPAVMLLLPAAKHPLAGSILALSSTLAGNFIIVGSIANIIVVDKARDAGVEIGWREHARTGVPVTLATLAIAALWLMMLARW